MAAIVIDSPRWRDGWGEPIAPCEAQPALRLVDGGHRRPDRTVLRRRRLVVAVAALVLVAVVVLAAVTLSRPASAGAMPEGRRVHVVEPGDTYWSIADRYHDRGDLRLAVDALIDANGARPLFPGDTVELP